MFHDNKNYSEFSEGFSKTIGKRQCSRLLSPTKVNLENLEYSIFFSFTQLCNVFVLDIKDYLI